MGEISVRFGGSSQDRDCLCTEVRHVVEHWNERYGLLRLTDFEIYLHRKVNLAFVTGETRGGEFTKLTNVELINDPYKNGTSLEYKGNVVSRDIDRKVRDQFIDFHSLGQRRAVYMRDKKFMLVSNIQGLNEVEYLIPTSFRVGLQATKCCQKSCARKCGVTVFDRLPDFVCPARKGKLNLSLFANCEVGSVGEDYLPENMIERGSEIMDCVSTDKSNSLYRGFVSFDSKRALSGLYVCFHDEDERLAFVKNFPYFSDVFFGPLNF